MAHKKTKIHPLIYKRSDKYVNEDGGCTIVTIVYLFRQPIYKKTSETHPYSNKEFQKSLLEAEQYFQQREKDLCS